MKPGDHCHLRPSILGIIIHASSMRAAKFWIGELAQIASHVVLLARLIVKEPITLAQCKSQLTLDEELI